MMNYFSFIIVVVAVATATELTNSANKDGKVSGADSTEFRLTKLLNIELGSESEKLDTDLRKTVLSAVKRGFEDLTEPARTERYTPQQSYNQEEVVAVLKELYSEIITLKKNVVNIANSVNSECLVQSDILGGKSFPVGTSYHRLCPPNVLDKEVNEINKYFPQSCKEIQEKGNNISGVYQIQPKQSEKPFIVLCDMETKGGGWVHIQKRYDGSVDFFLGWREYKFGFGDLETEFWLGLENIYKLTGFEANELLVEIVDRENNKAYAHYKRFAIGSEAEGYPLKVLSNFSGDAGDSLVYHLGKKFTTKDFDQDNNSGNCAVSFSGAWWYDSCHVSNLNGKYRNAELTDQYKYQGMHWKDFKSYTYSHAKSRMMVRPVG